MFENLTIEYVVAYSMLVQDLIRNIDQNCNTLKAPMFIIIIFSRFDLQYDMFKIIFISLPIKKKKEIGDEKEHAILEYLVCDEEVHKKAQRIQNMLYIVRSMYLILLISRHCQQFRDINEKK